MGSGSSKEKAALSTQLEELNQKYRAAVQTIALRENQITDKERDLEAARREASETQGLRERVAALEKEIEQLKLEKEREVGRLKDELSRELSGQLRVAESLTQERNLARKELAQVRERLRGVEAGHAEEVKRVRDEAEREGKVAEERKVELEAELKGKGEEVEGLKGEVEGLRGEKEGAVQREQAVTKELSEAKGRLAEGDKEREGLSARLTEVTAKLEESEKAREQLTEGSRTVNDELAAAKEASEGEARKLREMEDRLAGAQKQIAHLETSRDNLQKQNNEGISKRSALHEAFSATKIELSEWVEGYRKLQAEKKGVDERVGVLEKEVEGGKGAVSGEEAGRLKKEVEQTRREAEEATVKVREEVDGLRAELEAAKKTSANGETSQKTLKEELEAAKKQHADADEAAKKLAEEHDSEMQELRNALREAKEGLAKPAVEEQEDASDPAPTTNGGSIESDAPLEKGHAAGKVANGVEHDEKVDEQAAVAAA